MLLAHTTKLRSQLFVRAKEVTRMLEMKTMFAVEVRYLIGLLSPNIPHISDSCTVNNGGCDKNADCSHDKTTFAVVCTCKTGYTNVGTPTAVKCEGSRTDTFLSSNLSSCSSSIQIVAMLKMVVAIPTQSVHMIQQQTLSSVLVKRVIQMWALPLTFAVEVSFDLQSSFPKKKKTHSLNHR